MSARRGLSEHEIIQALLDAYRRGYFPMAEQIFHGPGGSRIHWFSPDPRGIVPLSADEGFHVPRRLESRLRASPFTLRLNTAFEAVMRGCARRRAKDDPGDLHDHTWIDETIVTWYLLLHRAGHAHSLEAWANDDAGRPALVGGIYGVAIGAAFFGESMFHAPRPRLPTGARHPLDGTDASKICLVTLVRALHDAGFVLFDTQMLTAHVRRFGGLEIPRRDYLRRLDAALAIPDRWPSLRIT
ncbi:MAG: leucyl/phenylalanyl-tRNA--protein transferase [Planctomycetota bacterium]|nr:leucyl/phenylalanyl-tRNA--protein transferase [Planctomycetota bacterium]